MSTRERTDVLPHAVPLAEQGLLNYNIALWFGMWAPMGTPSAFVQELNTQVTRIVQNAHVREQLDKLGIGPSPMSPDQFAGFVRNEIATYRQIVKQAGIQPN